MKLFENIREFFWPLLEKGKAQKIQKLEPNEIKVEIVGAPHKHANLRAPPQKPREYFYNFTVLYLCLTIEHRRRLYVQQTTLPPVQWE
mgnify:CR=1 FL=1